MFWNSFRKRVTFVVGVQRICQIAGLCRPCCACPDQLLENRLSRVSLAVLLTGAALVSWGAVRYVMVERDSAVDLMVVPQPPVARFPKGVQEQLEQSRAIFDKVLAAEAGTSGLLQARAYGELGKVYTAYECFDEAAVCFTNASRLQPDEFRWPYLMAYALDRNGTQKQIRVAAELYNAALGLMQRDMSADPLQIVAGRLRLGESYRELDERERAAEQFEAILVLRPNHSEALLALAQMASQDGRNQDAIEYLERAIAAAPTYKDATAMLAAEYARKGDRQHAADLQARAESIDGRGTRLPDPLLAEVRAMNQSAATLNRTARSLVRAGKYSRAVGLFRQVLEIEPHNSTAQLNLADLMVRAGQIEEGHRLYRSVIAGGDGAELAHRKLGYSLLVNGQTAESLDQYRRVVAMAPQDSSARYFMGAGLSLLGRHEEALAEFRTVCDADSSHVGARVGRARMLYALGDYAAAQQSLEEEVAAGDAAPPIRMTLARILAACPQDDLRDGARALELARELFGEGQSVDGAETLAMAYAETGDFDRAVETQQWAVDRVRTARRLRNQLPHVGARLELYRSQQPCRDPWSDREQFPSFVSPNTPPEEKSGAAASSN